MFLLLVFCYHLLCVHQSQWPYLGRVSCMVRFLGYVHFLPISLEEVLHILSWTQKSLSSRRAVRSLLIRSCSCRISNVSKTVIRVMSLLYLLGLRTVIHRFICGSLVLMNFWIQTEISWSACMAVKRLKFWKKSCLRDPFRSNAIHVCLYSLPWRLYESTLRLLFLFFAASFLQNWIGGILLLFNLWL